MSVVALLTQPSVRESVCVCGCALWQAFKMQLQYGRSKFGSWMLFGKFSGQGLVHSNNLWVMQETFTECADLSLIWKQRSHWRHMSNNELQMLCLKFKLYKIMLFKQPWLVNLSESSLGSVYGTSTKFDTLPVDYDVWRRWMNATLHCSCCAVQAHKTLSWAPKIVCLKCMQYNFSSFRTKQAKRAQFAEQASQIEVCVAAGH